MPEEPAERFVDRMLAEAWEADASDLYWIPHENGVEVRRRIDGMDGRVELTPKEYGLQCIARIKVMAGLLTYRSRSAQDGAIRNADGGAGTQMRVSVMPTLWGERVAVRFLKGNARPDRLDELGIDREICDGLKRLIARESGLLLLTGPTGSGKTTTIYALIRELLATRRDPSSIITLEDPIECMVPGISQTSITPNGPWNYEEALKAALRQDVKVVVVGEMRDREVIRVTLDAALSGHLVISTYHAGDIAGVYARILHQGFEPFLVASTISGVLAQRLMTVGENKPRQLLAAFLEPDDAWRDFVISTPGLESLRQRLRQNPYEHLSSPERLNRNP